MERSTERPTGSAQKSNRIRKNTTCILEKNISWLLGQSPDFAGWGLCFFSSRGCLRSQRGQAPGCAQWMRAAGQPCHQQVGGSGHSHTSARPCLTVPGPRTSGWPGSWGHSTDVMDGRKECDRASSTLRAIVAAEWWVGGLPLCLQFSPSI